MHAATVASNSFCIVKSPWTLKCNQRPVTICYDLARSCSSQPPGSRTACAKLGLLAPIRTRAFTGFTRGSSCSRLCLARRLDARSRRRLWWVGCKVCCGGGWRRSICRSRWSRWGRLWAFWGGFSIDGVGMEVSASAGIYRLWSGMQEKMLACGVDVVARQKKKKREKIGDAGRAGRTSADPLPCRFYTSSPLDNASLFKWLGF